MQEITDKHKMRRMVLLFMFTYLISYVTRINYGVVISDIVQKEGILKSAASLALTGSAVAYGMGQLLSGYFGDKIQPKRIVLMGLIITGIMNVLIPFCKSPYQMTLLWVINGLAQALMWPPLVKLMSYLFSPEDYKKAVVVVVRGSSYGTILVYLVAPLCIYLSGWRSVFFLSAAAAVTMVVIWGIKCPHIDLSKEISSQTREDTAFPWSLMLIGILFAIVVQGFLRDGVTIWMPSMISETFHLSSNISILSGVAFAVFNIFVFQMVSEIYRRAIHNELVLAGLLFTIGALAAPLLALFKNMNAPCAVAAASILIGSMHGVNLILVCMIPPYFAQFGRVSLVSGIFNSFAYLGSAVSAYGMATYTEQFGWSSTVYLWGVVALVGGVLCFSFARKWSKF